MNEMIRVTPAELAGDVARYQNDALTRVVVVTGDGEDRTVLISAVEYRRLKRRDREVLGIGDFTEEDVQAVRQARPSAESAEFDHELLR